MSLRSFAALLVSAAMCACASVAGPGASPAATDETGGEILVMLRTPPPHYRADRDYGAGYAASSARAATRGAADRIASDYGLARLDDWAMPALGLDCFLMRLRPAQDTQATLDQLTRDPRVESAQAMQVFRVLGHDDPLFALQPAAGLWRLDELHALTTGRHVRVAAIDSGVEADHPDLRGQIDLARDFVGASPPGGEMHGTAVAGIIAARADNGIGSAGVAPDARLLALRACWETSTRTGAAACNTFTLAKALQFSLESDVHVINMSVGGPRDRLLERLLDLAAARGIAVVGAVDPAASDGGFPATHPGVVAIAEAGSDARDTLQAPGRDIPTTLPGRAWGFVSGSSYAAAQASGLAALLRELAPAMSPAQLRAVLAHRPPDVEHGAMIDACDAIARTSGRCACQCAVARDTRPQLPR